jgi:hypothetical protein
MKAKSTMEHQILAAYRPLVRKLERLVGYRVGLLQAQGPSPNRFRYSADGHLQYSILVGKSVHLATLELDAEAREDEFATKTAQQFVNRAGKLFGGCRHARDLKQTLLRDEPIFWDELVIGFAYPKNEHPESLRLLWTLRNALHFRYEGQLPKVGALVTWNMQTVSSAENSSVIAMQDSPYLDDLLRDSKASYLLSNGEQSIYLVRGRRVIYLLYRSSASESTGSQEEGWEFVPAKYRWLRDAIKGRDFAVVNSDVGEQILVTSKAVLKWSRSQWTRITHSRIASMFPAEYPADLRRLILDIVGSLSHRHMGALIILPTEVEKLFPICSAGLSSRLSGMRFMNVCAGTREVLENLCAIDGGTIIDDQGAVVDAGVLVKLGSPSGEGARSAAAIAASEHGLAIKVSHDGPITFFAKGKRIATVG